MQLGCAAFPGGSPFSEGSWHCYPQTQLAPASEISLCSTLTASYLLQVCCIFSNSNFLIKKKKLSVQLNYAALVCVCLEATDPLKSCALPSPAIPVPVVIPAGQKLAPPR